jgi:hypothetical protein
MQKLSVQERKIAAMIGGNIGQRQVFLIETDTSSKSHYHYIRTLLYRVGAKFLGSIGK